MSKKANRSPNKMLITFLDKFIPYHGLYFILAVLTIMVRLVKTHVKVNTLNVTRELPTVRGRAVEIPNAQGREVVLLGTGRNAAN
jgi:hypothetical protein